MEHFVYFISYHILCKNGSIGFGNGTIDLKKKLEKQEEFSQVEKAYIDELNAMDINRPVANVVIINYQLLKQFTE